MATLWSAYLLEVRGDFWTGEADVLLQLAHGL